jgi:hypothetical protein
MMIIEELFQGNSGPGIENRLRTSGHGVKKKEKIVYGEPG